LGKLFGIFVDMVSYRTFVVLTTSSAHFVLVYKTYIK